MEISIPISDAIQLVIRDEVNKNNRFPTSRLQKGWRVIHHGQDLTTEAVGFGVPVIKCGLRTIFPGGVELSATRQKGEVQVDASFLLNLEEKTVQANSEKPLTGILNRGKHWASALIRHLPWLRKFLMGLSRLLRSIFGWKTTYQISDINYKVPVQYRFIKDRMTVAIDLSHIQKDRITEFVVMNEQGADYFCSYTDSSGKHLQGKDIGCWDEVKASEATFFDSGHQVSFSLKKIGGSKLFYGLELDDSRLAWSGFGYTFPPGRKDFSYVLKIGGLG